MGRNTSVARRGNYFHRIIISRGELIGRTGGTVSVEASDRLILVGILGSVRGVRGYVGGTPANADWVLKFWQHFGGAVRQNCFSLKFSK